MTSVMSQPLTYDDLLEMLARAEADGYRYEIIDGDMLVSPVPAKKHQRLAYLFTRLVGDAVDARGLGHVYFAPVDVRLGPHDIVQPDVIFIRQDRLHIYQPGGVVEGPSDLVVEIVSPSSRTRDTVKKLKLYAWAGVPEHWLTDPEDRTFRLFVLRNGRYEELTAIDGVFSSTVIPGLRIDPAARFADLD